MKRKPWKRLESKNLFEGRVFNLRSDKLELPDGRVMPSYYVLEFPDWVNIVPVTKTGEIVMVEQYRHGTAEYTLELPGGTTDPHTGESAQTAAVRELLEETGYKPEKVQFLGKQAPNPALQSNFAHSFLALNCEKVAETSFDQFEDIQIVLKTPREIYQHIKKGEINHSLMVVAFHYALPYLGVELRDLT